MKIPWNFLLFGMALLPAFEAGAEETPVELGKVEWLRDYGEAQAQAKASGKPILILFQEVPGWQTCKNLGSGPLSDEDVLKLAKAFVPLCIYNNRKGKDEETLKAFKEPAWNNPVVRFVDAGGKDLIPRKDGVYSKEALLERMKAALDKSPKSSGDSEKKADADGAKTEKR